MRKFVRIFTVLLLLIPGLLQSNHNNVNLPEGAVNAMKSGNASELVKYFNSSIELDILGKDAIYSKSQAEAIMKDFFSKYPPSAFVIKFEGGRDNSQYAVGTLSSDKGNFRVNFLIKGQMIHQLRIDRE